MAFELTLVEGLLWGAALGGVIALVLRYVVKAELEKVGKVLGFWLLAGFCGALPILGVGARLDAALLAAAAGLLFAMPVSTSISLACIEHFRHAQPHSGMRLRPWHVFFAIWIPFAFGVDALIGHDRDITYEKLSAAKSVAAHVVSGRFSSGPRASNTVYARLEIPSTLGITSCEASMGKKQFDDVWGGEIEVRVLQVPGAPPRCFANGGGGEVRGDIGAHLAGSMLFGAMLAWLVYYPLIRMETSASGSLRTRWEAEKQGKPAAELPANT
jgi:hypothetical protein